MLPLEEATALVQHALAARGETPGDPARVERFEARLTSRGWLFASGSQIQDEARRAKDLVRRRGWEFD